MATMPSSLRVRPKRFSSLFQDLTQQTFAESGGSPAELVQIGFLTACVHRFRPDGGSKMYLRQQLGELLPGLSQVCLLVLVRRERDYHFMHLHTFTFWVQR